MLTMGQINESGLGMRINQEKAQEYYKDAADADEPLAQVRLAKLIIEGKYLNVD